MILRYLEWLWTQKGFRWEVEDAMTMKEAIRIMGEDTVKWLSERIEPKWNL